MKGFGKKLKEIRLEKKLTQIKVAKSLNIAITTYASWEQDLSEPKIEMILKLCELFEVTADELLKV